MLYYIYKYKQYIYHVAAVVQWMSVGLAIRRSGVRISWQTKIVKKSLVTPVNSETIVRLSFIGNKHHVRVW